MSKKNDNVFQISLTEIAFTLILLLVLLLGFRLNESFDEIKKQKDMIENQINELNKKTKELEKFNRIRNLGGVCKLNPNDPIEALMPCYACISNVEKISRTEAKDSLDLGRDLYDKWLNREDGTLSFKDFKNQLNLAAEKLAAGHHLVLDEDVQKELDKAKKLKNDYDHLRSQLAETESQNQDLMKTNKYLLSLKGLGYPPCWLNQNNKVEYLFDVVIKDENSYQVRKADWSELRAEQAMNIPGVKEMLEKENLTKTEFQWLSKRIMSHSNQAKPTACRHFVTMRSEIPDRETADMARKFLENFFYKYEK